MRPVVASALESVVHYPDPECSGLVAAAALRYGVPENQILVGNGSTELLHLLPRATGKLRAVMAVPTYADYTRAADEAGLEVSTVRSGEDAGFVLDVEALEQILAGDELVFLSHPNNPTGVVLDADRIRWLASAHPSTFFVVDEAFGDFVEDMDSLTVRRPANVVVLLSLTKIFAIPGIRLGCAVADPGVVASVGNIQPFWSVNTLAQAVGEAAMADRDYVERSRRFVTEQRSRLQADLASIPGLYVYPGRANFLLVRTDRTDATASSIAEGLLDHGIAIRLCGNFEGLDERFFRVAVRTGDENMRLCEALDDVLRVRRFARRPRTTPAIMFQGTSSNAGKSVLTAALCRILLQDGYRVAPFKAQNMSLNSFVTRDGGEMGRAQVVQSQACRLEPDVRMNPVLLKPNSDTGSQVILLGKPVGNMDVLQYVRYKPKVFQKVTQAYDSLCAEHDVMVLEGAGSPAEVNLKHHDIVNMQMARYAGAQVLLAGDIDRGGVFASFVGTMEVLAEWERALVAGFVVNRFRGDSRLLADALDYTFRHTGRPVFGVVPYFQDLGLPEEDSVSFQEGVPDSAGAKEDSLEIALVDLPHISNFTDFDALRIEPDVRVTKVRRPEDLVHPDAVIVPGSKNVIGDMEHLREKGLDVKLRSLIEAGQTEIVGICGGFQMIGSRIADPHCLESDGKTMDGLGFLSMTTVLAQEKTLTRVSARHLESGLEVHGYEIHHGKTESGGLIPLLDHADGASVGVRSADGRLWGTYIHGIFDSDEFRRWFLDRLRVRKGLPAVGKVCAMYNLEPAFDRLAEAVRASLRMEKIYGLLGL
jgi:adenosylcobyric acid synthase